MNSLSYERLSACPEWQFGLPVDSSGYFDVGERGVRAFDTADPYRLSAKTIAAMFAAHDVRSNLVNMPSTQRMGIPPSAYVTIEGAADFREAFSRAQEYAEALRSSFIHVLAGPVPQGGSREAAREAFSRNIDLALEESDGCDTILVIEPISSVTVPGYLLEDESDAMDLCEKIGSERLKVLFDAYHAQVRGADLAETFSAVAGFVGHIQVGSFPDRNEPDPELADWSSFFRTVENEGYRGLFGCEYRESGRSEPGSWAMLMDIAQGE